MNGNEAPVVDLARLKTQSRRYFRKRAFTDALSLVGIASSALSLTFLIIDFSNFDIADFFSSIYMTFREISFSLYLLMFSWLRLDMPAWAPTACTAYFVLGMTAARTALIYLGDGTAVTHAHERFDFGSSAYMGFLFNVVRWTGRLRPLFIVPFVAPIWPYLFLSSHEAVLPTGGGVIETNYRRMFLPVLAATLLTTLALTAANVAMDAYTPESVFKRGQISVAAITTSNVNLRAGPSTRTRVIVVVPAGTSVRLRERRLDGWSEVEYAGRRGFIYSRYLSELRDGRRVPATAL